MPDGNELIEVPQYIPVDVNNYGKQVKRSTLCSICLREDMNEINLMRARDHLSYDEIIAIKEDVTLEALKIHFKNHFHISANNRRILEIKENTSPEANELIHKIFDKELDVFSGIQSVLESKAERLLPIRERMRYLTDKQEIDALDDVEIAELIQLNKLAEDIENSIIKTWQIMDKKLFPIDKKDRENAILQYKLDILKGILDRFQFVFNNYEKIPQYTELIQQLRIALAEEINSIEDEILKSGGILQSKG